MDKEKQAIIQQYKRCKNGYGDKSGLWYFMTLFVKTLDSSKGVKRKFPEYGYLKDLLSEVDSGQNLLVEKTRQMTVSWSICAYLVYCLLFRDNFQALILSRKEELVDKKGDIRSLFEKMRFIITHLPEWLQPTRYDLDSSHMKLSLRSRQSAINGESANEDAGRGGNYNIVVGDEWAFIDHSELVYAALKEGAKQVVLVSTPNGKDNNFYRIRHATDTGFKIMSLHWRLHPERNDVWYQEKVRGYAGNETLRARELDISYLGSIVGKCFPEFDTTKHVLNYNPLEIREDIKNYEEYAGFDFGIGADTAFITIYKKNNVFYIYDEHSEANLTIKENANIFQRKRDKWGVKNKKIVCYADPSGNNRDLSGNSAFHLYRLAGIMLVSGSNKRKNIRTGLDNGINVIKTLLLQDRLYVYSNCVWLIEALQSAAFKTNRLDEVVSETYEHDKYSHILDALVYCLLKQEKGLITQGYNTNWSEEPSGLGY